MPDRRLLVIAAHPDDEVLGCGGTVRRYVDEGWDAMLVVLTAGVAGRHAQDTATNDIVQEQQTILQQEMHEAVQLLGFHDVIQLDFPDNRLDTVSRMDIALPLMEMVQDYCPRMILTHHPGDYNWDHIHTFDAALMAARPNYPDHTPQEIWAFEVLSSTERAWQNGQNAFQPNIYVNIHASIQAKKQAMQCYTTESRAYPHPRSVEGIEYLARKRGLEVGLTHAEAFELIRRVCLD